MTAIRTAMKTIDVRMSSKRREHARRNPVEIFHGFLGITTDAVVRQ